LLSVYTRAKGPLPRNALIMAIAGSIADPVLATTLTPEGVELLLRSGWVDPELAERPAEALGLNDRSLGSIWQIFINSEHGLDQYAISFPADRPFAERFELQWRLHGLKWRVAGIRVPERLANMLVERIVDHRP
jgi:hypothetical protein